MRQTAKAPLGVIAVSLVAIAVNFPAGGSRAYAQDPSQVGQWEWESLASPVPATNEFVLPTGLVVLVALGGQQNWGTLWDPLDGNYTYKPAPRQTNCSGFCQLPDGRTLVAGGGPSGLRSASSIHSLKTGGAGHPQHPWRTHCSIQAAHPCRTVAFWSRAAKITFRRSTTPVRALGSR